MNSRLESILFYGDSGVGKTSLIKRLLHDKFDGTRDAQDTLNYSFAKFIKKTQPVHAKIYDFSAASKYGILWSTHVQYCNFVVLVFDVNNQASFDSIQTYIDTARANQHIANPYYFLLGNQCDDPSRRVVTEKAARDFAGHNNLIYIETSAKTGHGISTLRDNIVQLMQQQPPVANNATPKEPAHLALVQRIHAFQIKWEINPAVGYICNMILKAGTQDPNPQFYFTAKLPGLKAELRYLAGTWRSVLNSILNVAMTVAVGGIIIAPLLAGFACANLVAALAGLLLFGSVMLGNQKTSGHACMFFAFCEKQATQTMCNEVFTQLKTTVRI